MKTEPKKQAVATAPAKLKLKLEPEAFNAELSQIVGENKVGYTTDEHIRLVEGIIPKLTDENGDAPKLDQGHWDRLRLIFRPTEDLQRAVLRQTFDDAGYALDADAEQALVLLFNAPQFADFLAKTVNDETGKPFIVKEKKRGIKKNTFAALISAGRSAMVM
jgi:hypothetical protein